MGRQALPRGSAPLQYLKAAQRASPVLERVHGQVTIVATVLERLPVLLFVLLLAVLCRELQEAASIPALVMGEPTHWMFVRP